MPLYAYRCAQGHEVEAIAPLGTVERACACGLTAIKRTVYAVSPKLPAVRHAGRDFIEASQTVEHNYAEYEKREGVPVERPHLWDAAKQRASQAAGNGWTP